MNFKIILALLDRTNDNRGFAVVIAMAMGLIVMVASMTIMVRSQTNQNDASAKKAITKSAAVAETAITRYLTLINQYRSIATYCANASSEPSCNTGATWSNITDTIVNSSSTPTANFCSPSTPTTTSFATTTINPRASTTWTPVDPSDLPKGSYRLISYTYTPDVGVSNNNAPGTGKLVVEGQVNESTTRLAVDIPVIKNTSTSPGSGSPGLWISWNPDSAASGGSMQIQSDIKDSTCPADSNSGNVSTLTSYIVGGHNYSSTPGEPFPPLPSEGQTAPMSGTGIYSFAKVTNTTGVLPMVGDSPAGNVYTYHLTDTGKSIDLSGGNNLTIGTGAGETVVLYLDSDMVLSGGSAITIAAGSELIVYAKGKIDLSGGSASGPIQNLGTPDKAEVYVYNGDDVKLTGGPGMKVFIFAPNSNVEQTGASTVDGTIWSKSWKASGGSILSQQAVDLAQTKLANTPQDKISIKAISSWKREASQ